MSRAVIEGRPGPTVDGRPYAQAPFVKEIEAYHKAAVLAHQSHSGIMLSLPVAPELEDDSSVGWTGAPSSNPRPTVR